MSGRLLGSVILMWLLFMVAAVLNGSLREFVIAPQIGEYPAHLMATAILCAIILVGACIFVRLQRLQETRTLLQVGVMWLVATVLFEFVFGHYVIGHSWERLLADYNLLQGRVWVLVLLVELVGPLLCARLQAGRRPAS